MSKLNKEEIPQLTLRKLTKTEREFVGEYTRVVLAVVELTELEEFCFYLKQDEDDGLCRIITSRLVEEIKKICLEKEFLDSNLTTSNCFELEGASYYKLYNSYSDIRGIKQYQSTVSPQESFNSALEQINREQNQDFNYGVLFFQ